MIDTYVAIAENSINIAFALSLAYVILSLGYYTYRYMKGDDHPAYNDIHGLKDITKFINPFYYKHPINTMVSGWFIIGGIASMGIVWPFVVPVTIVYYTVRKIRSRNLEKRKMWTTLQE